MLPKRLWSFAPFPVAAHFLQPSILNPLAGVPTWAQRLNKRVHRKILLLASRAFAKAVRQFKIRQKRRPTAARLLHCLQVIPLRQRTRCTE
ncbi:hypothetical protein EMEDMD4_650037 [Sinorhizobium medicae]|uniref:Uncharacterized protein n=1 Tax=Sinorhizobium medicae TaxID=110321 RepID=A0A508X4A5_9HYPH|nr:hypothetical protein EMEDMD4_650037 [Sinorhizobium medicae]